MPSNSSAIEDEWKKQIPGCEVNKNVPLCYNTFTKTNVVKEDIFSIHGKSMSVPRMKWSLAPRYVPCVSSNDQSSLFGVQLLKQGVQQHIPVPKVLPCSAIQSQVFLKPIDKNPATPCQSNKNRHDVFKTASTDVHLAKASTVTTRESPNEQNTTISSNIQSDPISASGVFQSNPNVAVGGITSATVDGPIVGVFVMIPNSINLPGGNWYSMRATEETLFCCETIFIGEVSVVRKGVKIDVKAKSISYSVYQDALPVDKELPCGLYRNFEDVNSLNETLKIFHALPLCTGIDRDVQFVQNCSTIDGIFKNGVWRSIACSVFPDSREVDGLCGSCFSLKQALLSSCPNLRREENLSTSLTNIVYKCKEDFVKTMETQNEIKFLKQKLKRTETLLMEKEIEIKSMREKIDRLQEEAMDTVISKRMKTKD